MINTKIILSAKVSSKEHCFEINNIFRHSHLHIFKISFSLAIDYSDVFYNLNYTIFLLFFLLFLVAFRLYLAVTNCKLWVFFSFLCLISMKKMVSEYRYWSIADANQQKENVKDWLFTHVPLKFSNIWKKYC